MSVVLKKIMQERSDLSMSILPMVNLSLSLLLVIIMLLIRGSSVGVVGV